MAESSLPSGIVTFLFTDIEGSTRLWERDPDAMRVAIGRHNAILDAAITAHGGSHFKSIGDAYAVAFSDAPAAVAVAVTAQRDLAAEPWRETGPLRVRMAVHAGEATPIGGDYLAPCLNRLSRLLATGYGGQVLLTDVVLQLVAGQLPDGATPRDLGRHRLRDLLEPLAVAQLVIAGLPDHFPPLKSLERGPTNLPVQPTPLIGREEELAAIRALLGRADVRLVTLTGVGGTGKTRLGLQVAAELADAYADGAFFVDLAPLADPALVLPTIAATLGVRESGGLALRDALMTFLAEKRLLLVLDNFEQVLPAASAVADLLGACAGMELIVTSRARLGLRAEHEYAVSPLPIPDIRHLPPLAELAAIAAVSLFVLRATAARHDFALTEATSGPIAEISARLDGLPLAIELAAARMKTLPPRAILDRLGSRFKLLTGGARDLPERQRTLRATIDWSHGLLPEPERALFRRLAVFAGGFDLEAAEAVVGDDLDVDLLDGVTSLVDQSLLRQTEGPDGEPRFTMLETLREFGLEQLAEAGEVTATRRAHAAWSLALVERADANLTGPDQVAWLERLETEHDNLRAALSASAGEADDLHLRLAGLLWRFWRMHGHLSEGRRWLDAALTRSDAAALPERSYALNGAGVLAHMQGDLSQATDFLAQSLTITRALGDQARIAGSLNNLANVAHQQGDYDRALALHEEALAIRRALGDQHGIAVTLNNLGIVALARSDHRRAVELYEESAGIFRALGDDFAVAAVLDNLGRVVYHHGDYVRATALFAENLTIRRRLGDVAGRAGTLVNLGNVDYRRSDYPQAVERYEAALTTLRDLGDKRGVANCLDNLGLVAQEQGDLSRALALHTEALTNRREVGDKEGIAVSLYFMGDAFRKKGDYSRAAELHAESLTIRRETGDKLTLTESLESIAHLAGSVAVTERTPRLLGAAASLRDALGAPAAPQRAADSERVLADARVHLGEPTVAELFAVGRSLSVEAAGAEAQTALLEITGALGTA